MNPRQKYLARYAEPEASLECPTDRGWQHVVAIPACKEARWLPHTLQSLVEVDASGVLAIVIVNGREGADAETHDLNAQTLDQLASRQDRVQLAPDIDLGRLETIDVMVIDRASAGHRLAPDQGVGTARKIVADVALSLIDRGAVSQPWIWNTDADVLLPSDYLDAAKTAPAKTSALTLPFVHVPPEGASEAIVTASRLYDLRLRHYVDGLARAGSAWAFHTVGSTIVVHADHYARVRGFPKRNAAEDFYLLAKLAKTGTIHQPDTTPITLAGRPSDRVPFGTGAAIGKLIEERDPGAEYTFYDPRVFTELGHWLRAMDAFCGRARAQDLSRGPGSPLRPVRRASNACHCAPGPGKSASARRDLFPAPRPASKAPPRLV